MKKIIIVVVSVLLIVASASMAVASKSKSVWCERRNSYSGVFPGEEEVKFLVIDTSCIVSSYAPGYLFEIDDMNVEIYETSIAPENLCATHKIKIEVVED